MTTTSKKYSGWFRTRRANLGSRWEAGAAGACIPHPCRWKTPVHTSTDTNGTRTAGCTAGSATAATVRTIRRRATPDLLSGEICADIILPFEANERRRCQRSSSTSHTRRVIKGANTFHCSPSSRTGSSPENFNRAATRSTRFRSQTEKVTKASCSKLSRVIDATGDCMDACLGTKQALTSTQELNTWTCRSARTGRGENFGLTQHTRSVRTGT